MDLTPQVINEVEFSMARRGYDPDQVDEFLEKVAVAVGELTERIAELRERVVAAERRAEEAEQRAAAAPPERVVAAGPAPSPAAAAAVSAAAEAELETLKRTLLLAQRTADAAVREAEEEARQLVADAEAKAQATHEATLRRVLGEISQLEASREALRRDADALDRHVDAQRTRLTGIISDLQRILAEPTRLQAPPAPVDVAPPVEQVEPVEPVEPSTEPAESPASTDEESLAPRAEAPRFVVAEDDDADDEAWARFGDADDDVIDEGPRTEPVLRLDRLERGEEDGDDAYMSELRKAMLDDTGAPDAVDAGYFDEADAGRAARTRFGRRR